MTPPAPRRACIAALAFAVALALLGASVFPSAAAGAGGWTWPVEGEVLTPYRNGDDPYAAGQHRGIDIAAPEGATVRAATTGTVTFAGLAGSSGLTVALRTVDGRFDTSYLHLESVDVAEGDTVEPGSTLGTVGLTGERSAEAAHVHFGVRDAGERHAYRDPMLFLGAPGAPGPEPPAPPTVPPRLEPRSGRAPAPAPAPRAVPAPRPAPAPRPSPVPSRFPSPKGAPAPAGRPAPAGSRQPAPAGAPRRESRRPQPAGEPVPAPTPSLAPRPEPGPGTLRAPPPAHGPAALGRAPQAARKPAAPGGGGFDLGWVLGFVGLGVAAAAIGGGRRRMEGARRRGGRVAVAARASRPEAAARLSRPARGGSGSPAPSSIGAWPTT